MHCLLEVGAITATHGVEARAGAARAAAVCTSALLDRAADDAGGTPLLAGENGMVGALGDDTEGSGGKKSRC